MRCKIAHNQTSEQIESKALRNWCHTHDSTFKKEKLQTKVTGYHPIAINLDDLEEAIRKDTQARDFKFELRIEFIKMFCCKSFQYFLN